MKKILKGLWISVFAILSMGPLHAQLAPSPHPLIGDSLQLILNSERVLFGSYGAIMGLYAPGHWYWSGSSGMAQINPLIPADTNYTFRAASLSKSMVAASLLQLQADSVLSLDDYLTVWLSPQVTDTIAYANQIEIRHLLQHTSGIRNYSDNFNFQLQLWLGGLNQFFSPQQLINYGTEQGPITQPGILFSYSNTNYVLAALIIEAATGQSYELYLQNNILSPLGMTNSYFPITDTLPGNFMGCYFDVDNNGSKEDFSYFNPSGVFGSGPIVSTLADMLKWRVGLENGLVLDSASYADMQNFIPIGLGSPTHYGLGLQRIIETDYSTTGHSGSIFNSSNMQYFEGMGVYVVYNFTDWGYLHGMMDLLAPHVERWSDSCMAFQPFLQSPANSQLDPGDSVVLYAPAGSDFQWYQDGQIMNGANLDSLVVYTAANYSVELSNGYSCLKQSNSITITGCSATNLQISPGDTAVCPGTMLQLTAGNSGDSINWYLSDGTLLSANALSISITADSVQTYIAELIDSIGCMALDTAVVSLHPLPDPQLPPDMTVCVGEVNMFSVGAAGDSANWYINGNLISAGPLDLTHTSDSTEQLVVELFNSFGCVGFDTINLLVLPQPVIDIGPDFSACLGDTLLYDNTPPSPDYSLRWYKNNIEIVVFGPFFEIVVTEDMLITVELVGPCPSVFDSHFITAIPLPEIDLGADFQDSLMNTVSLSASWPDGATNWYDEDGNIILAGDTTLSFVLMDTTTIVGEIVHPCGIVRDSITVTPYDETADGLDLMGIDQFLTYPNPVKDLLHLELELQQARAIQLKVIDLLGKQYGMAINLPTSQTVDTQIDVSGLSSGMYVLVAEIQGIGHIYRTWIKE